MKIFRKQLFLFPLMLLLFFLFIQSDAYAVRTIYHKTARTGGGADTLDGVNGALLSNNDAGFVIEGGYSYEYILNSTSGATASSPWVIAPTTNPGNKRWILQGNKIITKAVLTTATELTIATGVITAIQTLHTVDTEADGATDDLVTITAGADGQLLLIRANNAARTVVIKETGNVSVGGSDITLDDTNKYIILVYDSGLSKWVMAGGGSAAVGDMTQAVYDTNADSMVDADKINAGIDAAKIGGGGVSTTEFDYLGTVTSNVQTQITAQIPKSTIVAAGDVLVGTAASTPGVITKGAINTFFSVNSAGVLGFHANFQQDDSAAQFASATASKGTRKFVQSSISDTMLLSDTPLITGNVTWTNISQGAGTYTRVFEEALNVFTVLQQFDATAGIKIGSTGVLITSDNDGAITFLSTSSGAQENLTMNLDDTSDEIVFSSTTGVTAIDFSGFVLKGKINTIVDNSATTYNVSAAEASSGTFFLNTNAGTKTYVLPAAAAGQMVCVKNGQGNAQILRFDTDGTDYIVKSTGARTTAAGDYYSLSADAKNQMCAVCFDATDWYITSEVGTASEE